MVLPEEGDHESGLQQNTQRLLQPCRNTIARTPWPSTAVNVSTLCTRPVVRVVRSEEEWSASSFRVRSRVSGGKEDAFAKGRTARLAQVLDVLLAARRGRCRRVAAVARHGGANECLENVSGLRENETERGLSSFTQKC
jgi:hypothetical protein